MGSSSYQTTVDGRERSFRIYRPPVVSTPAALVVMLHGGFGSAEQAEKAYRWDDQADAGHFVVAYPDGLGRAWSVGGGCCGEPGRDGIDDVAAITHIVATIRQRIDIDDRRIFATGMSNGGMLAYRLACESSMFAAIGPVAATQLGECAPPAPTSVIHIHGLADERVRFDGAQGDGVARIDGPPIEELINGWRAVNACSAAVSSVAATVTTSIARCSGGRSVELITVAGAGHQWPVAAPSTAQRTLADQPATALDATNTIWSFFAAHGKT